MKILYGFSMNINNTFHHMLKLILNIIYNEYKWKLSYDKVGGSFINKLVKKQQSGTLADIPLLKQRNNGKNV